MPTAAVAMVPVVTAAAAAVTTAAAHSAATPAPFATMAKDLPVFELPLPQLQQVAQSAGLQWVNSDADKVRAVQEAMAREPKPVHIPRVTTPVVLAYDGPLVLVETRKDLSQVKLPFEQAGI